MKHKILINSIIIEVVVMLLSSCAEHYVAIDTVDRNLDGSRKILTTSQSKPYFEGWQEDSIATPESFDFRSEKDTMRYAYTIGMKRNNWTQPIDSLTRMLQPEVSVSKSFRWFTTRYRYTARFPQLDSLPVPIDEYLTPEEQQLLFSPNKLPNDWTGTDLYDMLDKLNTKYVKWWSHCLFVKEMESYFACCDSAQRALLVQYHDTLLALVLAELPNEFRSIGNVATNFPELEFINRLNAISFDALQRAVKEWDLNTRVLWRTELPDGHTAEHMVSSDRMIQGDYVIEEHADTINWWVCILTLLLLAGGCYWAKRRFSHQIL